MTQIRRYYGYGLNNYPGTANDLKGCVNDGILARNILYRQGYDPKELRLFTDLSATRANLVQGFVHIASSNWGKDGGFFVFHFAGHGTVLQDVNRDEDDYFDEALVPIDFESDGLLIDDDIHDLMDAIPENVRGVFLFDCCYSGGATRYSGSHPGGVKSNNTVYRDRFLRLTPSMASQMVYGELPIYGNPPTVIQAKKRKAIAVPKRFLTISACSEQETAADAYIGAANGGRGAFHGAFTYTLFETLHEHNFNISYSGLVEATIKNLRSRGFTQTPTIEGDVSRLAKKWGA